ncbi:MAG: HEPN domain-containing protein [Acidimicrobiales bacterium]
MFEPESHDGAWWIPDQAHRRLNGRLVLEEGSLTLRTNGALIQPDFKPGTSYPLGVWTELPIVNGEVDGMPVTLIDVAGLSMAILSGEVHEVWHAQFALFGAHVHADALYDQIKMTCEHLDEFIDVPAVLPQLEWDASGGLQRARAEVFRTAVTTGKVPGVGRVEANLEVDMKGWRSSATLGLRSEWKLNLEAPIEILDAMTQVGKLRDLVRLSCHCECALTSAWVHTAQNADDLRVIRPLTSVGRAPCERSGFGRLFFTARLLPVGDETFARWWQMRTHYARAWMLLTVHDDGRFPNVGERFAVYARALEALHHADFSTPKLAESERDERITRALDAISEDLKEWAEPLLQAAYAEYFRVRIEEVVRSMGSVGSRLCGGDVEAFARSVTKTRNAIVHPPSADSQAVLDSHGQYWVGSALYWLAHCYLVMRLGMPEQDLDSRLNTLPGAAEVEERMKQILS